MMQRPRQGDIWIVELDPVVGHEQAKRRPCVIVSSDAFNQNPSDLVVFVPLTSQYSRVSWNIDVGELSIGTLKAQSFALCNHVRTVSLKRFSKLPIGVVSSEALHSIQTLLRTVLDL